MENPMDKFIAEYINLFEFIKNNIHRNPYHDSMCERLNYLYSIIQTEFISYKLEKEEEDKLCKVAMQVVEYTLS